MESLVETFRSFFPHRPTTQSNSYERTEESHYVYRLHPDGKGATVASSVTGNYRTPTKETGEMAGIFAGELDERGNLKQGGYQKFTREGDTVCEDVRGTVDPALLAEKVGITRPKHLKPFDMTKAAKPLSYDADSLVDELMNIDVFSRDPFLEPKVIQKAIK